MGKPAEYTNTVCVGVLLLLMIGLPTARLPGLETTRKASLSNAPKLRSTTAAPKSNPRVAVSQIRARGKRKTQCRPVIGKNLSKTAAQAAKSCQKLHHCSTASKAVSSLSTTSPICAWVRIKGGASRT